MSALWGHMTGVFIVVMMIVFIGIWIWAWLPYHKRTFGRLARLPMEDEAESDTTIPKTAEEDRR